jgi:hypothetical protein
MLQDGICLKVEIVELWSKFLEGDQVGERSGGPSPGGLGQSEVRPTGLLSHSGDARGAGVEPRGTDQGFAI